MTPEQFLTFADPLPEPMVLLTGNGLVLAGNRAVEKRLGVRLVELRGKSLVQIVVDPPDEVSHYLRSCSRSRSIVLGSLTLRKGEGENIPCRTEGTLLSPRSDGNDALLLLRLIPRESAVGQFVALNQRIEGLGREILRRREAEAEAREQAERLRVTLQSIGDAVIVTDDLGRVRHLNPVAEVLTGWTTSEAAGLPLPEVFCILNEQTGQPVENPALRALSEGVIVGLANHTVLIAKGGTERPIDDSAAPIRDDTGTVLGTVLVFRDVTERKQAERELQIAQRRFQAVFNQQFQFMAILAPDGMVLEANETCFRATGVPRQQVIGRPLWESPWWDRHPAMQEQWKRHIAGAAQGQGPLTVEMDYSLADGTLRHATTVITGLKNESGRIESLMVEGQDDTERKRNEMVLVAQKRVLELLVHGSPLPDVLDAICEVVEGHSADKLIATVLLVDEDGKRLRSVAGRRAPASYAQTVDGVSIGPCAGSCGTAAYRGEPVVVSDIASDPLWADYRDLALGHGLRACWSSPILSSQGHVLGTLAVYYMSPQSPSPDELRLVEILTRTAGVAIERRRDEASLREQRATAETLYRIGRLLSEELDLHKLVQVVTDEGTRLCGAQFGAFFYNFVGDRGEAYTLYTLSGAPLDAFAQFPMPRSTELFGPTFRGEGIIRLDDVTQDPRFGKNAPYFGMPEGHLPVRSYLSVPVVSRSGEVLGGLFFGHADAGVFTASQEQLLGGVAGQAAVAIDNTRLYQQAHVSAERLNLALSAADLGDWSWDAASDIVTFSKRAADIFGIPPGPHMSWTAMQDLLHPDDRDRARQEVERVIAERIQYDIEIRVQRQDGTLVWVGVLGRAVYDAADRVVGMYGVVHDITERKSLEESLRSSEERLRLALDAGRMGVWDWDIRTGDLKWSDSLEPLHGLAPGTFGGTFEDFQNLIHIDDRDQVNAAIRHAIEEGNGYEVEFRNPWPNGSVHWIAGKGKVFPAEDGQPGRMIGIGMDVTGRKRTEQTARFLADASAALAVLVDFDSTLQKVASLAVPSFADWATVDLLEDQVILRRVAVAHVDPAKVELAHEVHRRFPPHPEASQGVWSILRTGQPEIIPEVTDELLVQSIKDEEQLRIVRDLGLKSYIGAPLKVRGKTLGVLTFIAAESGHLYDETDLAVAKDLADRAAIAIENAQLYRELREADQRKDEFLATLAHELRNPLAPIRNGLQVLKLAGGGGEMVEEARSMMERQLGQMVRLVDDLLDVSRITRNKLELRKERVTLAAVIHSAIETSRPLIEQAGHIFSLTLAPSPVELNADLTRLAQVFSNLLNNSAKYTEPGGHIALTAERDRGEVVVRVQDNGLGIPAEALPRLFQMFSQVDRNMERAQGGLGIGLTLVRRLVEMHGGTVEVYSEGPGRGSEFTVRLPVLKDEPPVRLEPSMTDDPRAATSRRRILVVDDNRDSAKTLGMMLKLLGNETRTAHDGLAAVEVAEEFRPDRHHP